MRFFRCPRVRQSIFGTISDITKIVTTAKGKRIVGCRWHNNCQSYGYDGVSEEANWDFWKVPHLSTDKLGPASSSFSKTRDLLMISGRTIGWSGLLAGKMT